MNAYQKEKTYRETKRARWENQFHKDIQKMVLEKDDARDR